ncbi:MAG: cyclic nucleotide-binding domain-containing protein [Chloroflexi bacterium]|nr:cyclic nucleotide-binding domain-containing protein [Chloroflexota bacterium]
MSYIWLALITLAFLSVSAGLWTTTPESAIQYWYLYFSPLVLAALRFGLRGALFASALSVASILILYQSAQNALLPTLQTLEHLVETAASPRELRDLIVRTADVRATDPFTNLLRIFSGTALLVVSAILVGMLSDRSRAQEVENQSTQRMAQQLRRFFSPNLVDALLTSQQGVGPGSTKRKDLTVLFADLRGFTAMTERLEPEELIRILNEYLSTMTEVIFEFDGTLDKYLGDGIMAFFGDPIPYENHEERAIRAALKMRDRFFELRSRWVAEGREAVTLGIGINSGFVTVGSIGSATRVEYTVIGSNVNLASRLSSMAAPGQIVTSARTYSRIRHLVEARAIGRVEVRGLPRPMEVMEVLGYRLVPLGANGANREDDRLEDTIKRIVEDSTYRAWILTSPDQALADLELAEEGVALAQSVAALKGYPLFYNVPAAEIILLTRLASREAYRDGVVVVRQGDRDTKFFIIYRGEAAVLVTDDQGRELHVATLGRGNHFGEMSPLYNAPRTATIRAGERLEVLALDERNFHQLLDAAPILGGNIKAEARRRLASRSVPEPT